MAINIFFRYSVVDILYMLNLQMYMVDPGVTDFYEDLSLDFSPRGCLGNNLRIIEDSSLLTHRNSRDSSVDV